MRIHTNRQCWLNDVKDININAIQQLAKQGKAEAQCNLGFCYEQGIGINRDMGKAIDWYSKAANQGDAFAQFLYAVQVHIHQKLGR